MEIKDLVTEGDVILVKNGREDLIISEEQWKRDQRYYVAQGFHEITLREFYKFYVPKEEEINPELNENVVKDLKVSAQKRKTKTTKKTGEKNQGES